MMVYTFHMDIFENIDSAIQAGKMSLQTLVVGDNCPILETHLHCSYNDKTKSTVELKLAQSISIKKNTITHAGSKHTNIQQTLHSLDLSVVT